MKKILILEKKYIVIFIMLMGLCFLFPYTGDDWAWGSQIGIDRLNSWFDNYSGRYLGNLIVLVLTRSVILKTISMAVCLTGIVLLLDKLASKSKAQFYLILINLLFIPVVVLRQAVVWTSGFANYTTSIFLTLIYIYYVKNIYDDKAPVYSKWTIIPLLLLGFGNALIVEHLTIYNIFLGMYVIVVSFARFRKIYIQHVCYFLGTIAGTLYMFSNTVYRSVAEGSDTYRTIGDKEGILSKAINSFLTEIVKEGFLNNTILNLSICILCICVWCQTSKFLFGKKRIIGIIVLGIIIAFAATSMINEISGIQQLELLEYAEGAATIAYILALLIFIVILPVNVKEKIKLIFYLGSAGCMMAPLLIVTPIGSRCFFAPYVMLIAFIIELSGLLKESTLKNIDKMIPCFIVISVTAYLYLLYIYGMIFVCNNNRVEKAKNDVENGKTVIQVEDLPYTEYVWCSVPKKGSVWEERFKLFYGIDDNIEIENIESKLQ